MREQVTTCDRCGAAVDKREARTLHIASWTGSPIGLPGFGDGRPFGQMDLCGACVIELVVWIEARVSRVP